MLDKRKAIGGIVVLAALIYIVFAFDIPYKNTVDDFETCVAFGNPVLESNPRQCKDKKGNTFTEIIAQPSQDLIVVTSPLPNTTVTSPLTLLGEARGNWYFEASAPVQIIGADGKVLAESFVTAQGEWMTEEFVPFKGTIVFNPGKNTSGVVRFKKDNPSGLPEFDAQVDVPVLFKVNGSQTNTGSGGCMIVGCSSQICSDEDVITTCEFRPEYACYQGAECKRQVNGECGWTQTPQLTACLANPPTDQIINQ